MRSWQGWQNEEPRAQGSQPCSWKHFFLQKFWYTAIKGSTPTHASPRDVKVRIKINKSIQFGLKKRMGEDIPVAQCWRDRHFMRRKRTSLPSGSNVSQCESELLSEIPGPELTKIFYGRKIPSARLVHLMCRKTERPPLERSPDKGSGLQV